MGKESGSPKMVTFTMETLKKTKNQVMEFTSAKKEILFKEYLQTINLRGQNQLKV